MEIEFTEIFCFVDDFLQELEISEERQLTRPGCKGKAARMVSMTTSEILTILLTYPATHFACFKYYYHHMIRYHHADFPNLLSYSRFIQLMPRYLVLLAAFLQATAGKVTGISFIDSTKLAVCHGLRAKRHKVFQGLAAHGKTCTG